MLRGMPFGPMWSLVELAVALFKTWRRPRVTVSALWGHFGIHQQSLCVRCFVALFPSVISMTNIKIRGLKLEFFTSVIIWLCGRVYVKWNWSRLDLSENVPDNGRTIQQQNETAMLVVRLKLLAQAYG